MMNSPFFALVSNSTILKNNFAFVNALLIYACMYILYAMYLQMSWSFLLLTYTSFSKSADYILNKFMKTFTKWVACCVAWNMFLNECMVCWCMHVYIYIWRARDLVRSIERVKKLNLWKRKKKKTRSFIRSAMEAAGASLLAQSLLERISPVILLLPTPSVEESCKKNNLNFLQILHPFCNINQIDGKDTSSSVFL